MNYVLHHNEYVKDSEVNIDIQDRGYNFGDGIYEVIRVYEQRPFTLDMHINRLIQSAKKLDFSLPIHAETLKKQLAGLVNRNQLKDGIIYVQMTRGISPRNHLYQRNEQPIITAFTQQYTKDESLTKKGIDVWITDDIRWLRCDIKTINLLGNVMAKREATDHNCHEAILHRAGTVTEGSSSNIFVVKESTLFTHPATNLILNGITRQLIFELAKQSNLRIKEEVFSVEQLHQAEEAFITSTVMEIMPIRSINSDIKKTLEIGPITRKLQALFQDLIKK
ncbi:D-amino-acid transaminase [Bacillus solitudinis]|uniref:D-amino-acid transaminase n=1 Tax=Bacillus solitudinis TaxID=2014074 RepID=UPI000C23E375|nr:D-amino-acid transaminase [Bacillus solitudinis]